MELLYLLAGIIIGFVIAWFVAKNKIQVRINSLDKEKSILNDRLQNIVAENRQLDQSINQERNNSNELNTRIAKAEVEYKNLLEKLNTQKEELEKLQQKFTVEFENIAHKILKQNTLDFSTVSQKNMNEILLPLKDKIEKFEKKVEDTYEKGLKDQTDLKAELKKLHELNYKISEEAENLTKALKGDVKKMGNWGEVVLERILERSGLVKGREYETQYSTTIDEGKRIQPDIIVHLPEKKHIIIDSKVSLVAYERYSSADTENERQQAIKEHLISIQNHIKSLAEKNYQSAQNLNTPDFVLLFLPIESSFSVAIQSDQNLFNYAWDYKVVIVSPSTLLATLKTIASIWKQEQQTKHALEIARQSGALYDKFVNFILDMEKIGKGLSSVQNSYSDAMNKLQSGKGNLIAKAEQIRMLGAKASKTLPEKYTSEDETKKINEEHE